MLRKKFPNSDIEAQSFGGFMLDDETFCRPFDCTTSYSETLDAVNLFLFDNGFTKISVDDFDEELGYNDPYLSLSKHGYKDELVLFISKPESLLELDAVFKKLTNFRDERDWEQFHNSKDLALAISIEAAELLELFLWKKAEDFDEEKLREELADVLSFCFLLAERHGLNIPEIVNQKINKNALKYPVNKSKGTATKYTDL